MGSSTEKRILSLDGIRGIAIISVVVYHMFLVWPLAFGGTGQIVAYGWMGVDIFFALSGFLITTNLLDVAPGLQSLKTFYKRRAFRIWPLYFAILGLVCLRAQINHERFPWLLHIFMLQNFLPAWPPFSDSWSLCVEEHFYLFWPLLIFTLPRRALPFVIATVLFLEPCLRLYALHSGVNGKLIYTATPFRLA